MISKASRIYVAGHTGMVGSAILRELRSQGYEQIICEAHSDLDLLRQDAVESFFRDQEPEYLFVAAARVGGIQANIDHPAEFLYQNLQIQNNLIHSAHLHGVQKICFLASSCIFPRECPQPMQETQLLNGPLEPTNEGYAIAKIAGIRLCQFYSRQYGLKAISLVPCNLYGRNDSFDLSHSHVLSALVKRFVDAANSGAKSVVLWGSGIARREFLNVDDFASIAVSLFELSDCQEVINVGSGSDVSIAELAEIISTVVGFKGRIEWDKSKPDGMLRKCMDVSQMNAHGLKPTISLEDGVRQMVAMYRVYLQGGNFL